MDETSKLYFDIYSKFDLVYVKEFSPPEYDTNISLGSYSSKLLDALGITLYKHQAQAIKEFLEGNNVALVTPTASGKTLPYVISYLEELEKDPEAVALYIAPINALINDQAKKIDMYIRRVAPFVEVYPLTGGTSDRVRERIKSRAGFVLTNPEMLVYSMILYNKSWERFWKKLKIIIVDEIHEMSGVKGSHFGNLMRVVNMMNDIYGNNVRYFALSGTIGNPKQFIETIFGKKFVIIDRSTSGNKRVEFMMPSRTYRVMTSSSSMLIDTMKTFIQGLSKKVLIFINSRKGVEKLYKKISKTFLSSLVKPYRSGYDHNERVAIENMFRDGKIKGLISTSAFEMGIDIGDLDVVGVVGFPVSKISLRQRIGRTGRIRDGIVIFFPSHNMLDNYYYNNPRELFSDEVESLSANIYNDRVIGYYIALAIVGYNEATDINKNFIMEDIIDKYWGDEGVYASENFVKKTQGSYPKVIDYNKSYDGKLYFFTALSKNDLRKIINLRGIGKSFDIYDRTENKKIGEIAINYLFNECHPGGIYIHMGESFRVDSIDFDKSLVVVSKTDENFVTEVLYDRDIDILGTIKSKSYSNFSLSYCKLRVKETYTGYVKIRYEDVSIPGDVIRERRVIGYVEYPEPYVLEFETEGIVIKFDGERFRSILKYDEDIKYIRSNFSFENRKINEENILLSGLHAAEHSIIGMYPTEIICSRSEIGGVSSMSQLGAPSIVIYEGVEGGVGYSEIAFEKLDKIVEKAISVVGMCNCKNDSGCPSCIQSPKCGNANTLLSKRMGRKTLEFLLSGFRSGEVKEKNNVNPNLVKYSISYLKTQTPNIEENAKYAYYDLLEYPLENFKKPLVFDLETQKYSYEVGGWENTKDMLLSVAVVYDIKEDKFLVFDEGNVKSLIDLLFSSDIVIGYNVRNFDYGVLSRYDPRFEVSDSVKTFDILNDLIKKYVGENVRVSLDNLVRNNLNHKGKNSSSFDMPNLYREGKIDLVIKHCREDVMYTYEIMKKILKDKSIKLEFQGAITIIEFPEVIFRFRL